MLLMTSTSPCRRSFTRFWYRGAFEVPAGQLFHDDVRPPHPEVTHGFQLTHLVLLLCNNHMSCFPYSASLFFRFLCNLPKGGSLNRGGPLSAGRRVSYWTPAFLIMFPENNLPRSYWLLQPAVSHSLPRTRCILLVPRYPCRPCGSIHPTK